MKAWTRMVMVGLLAAGCGGGGGGTDPTADRTVIDIPDAGGGGDPDAAPVACTAETSYGSATLGNQAAFRDMAMMSTTPDVIFGGGSLNQDMMPDFVQLELFKGYTVFMTGEIVPGTYQLTGAELQYSSCGVCVRIFTDATMTGSADDYMATGGSVTVTSVSPNLTYTLSNITFEHVTINPMTFQSTPVNDGCETAITSASFDAPVMDAP